MRPHLAFVFLIGCGGTSGDIGADPDSGQPDAGGVPTADGGDDDATTNGDAGTDAPPPDAGPVMCAKASKYKTAFFGNLHQHTMNSLDAFSFGTRARPADAYLFAKGQTQITIGAATNEPAGPTVTIDRPLDFLAVTDHSEWMGTLQGCLDPASGYYDLPDCARVRSSDPVDETWTFAHIGALYNELCSATSQFQAQCAAEQRSVW